MNLVHMLLRRSLKKAMLPYARFRRQRPFTRQTGKPPRIAYWIAGGIGDGVMALPALAFLKKHFPESAIEVFAPPGKADLLAVLLNPFPVYTIGPGTVMARALQRAGYGFSFTNTIGAFRVFYELASRFSARRSAGFRYPGEAAARRLYDFSLEIDESSHDIDQNLALIAGAIGAPIEDADRCYPMDDRHDTRD